MCDSRKESHDYAKGYSACEEDSGGLGWCCCMILCVRYGCCKTGREDEEDWTDLPPKNRMGDPAVAVLLLHTC